MVEILSTIKVGDTYSGDELLNAGFDTGERLIAVTDGTHLVVAENEGNDNYKVKAIIKCRL